jgi:hypothetical protein
MGFRDGMRFEAWWAENRAVPFDPTNQAHADCRSAYDAGFEDGAKARASYDPKWDAD